MEVDMKLLHIRVQLHLSISWIPILTAVWLNICLLVDDVCCALLGAIDSAGYS
jgi:hypothetical protein